MRNPMFAVALGLWWLNARTRLGIRIRAGENRGKTLTNHNIVTEVKRIAQWRGQALSVAVKDFTLKLGEGCAILVQDNAGGPILGAAHCPAGAGG